MALHVFAILNHVGHFIVAASVKPMLIKDYSAGKKNRHMAGWITSLENDALQPPDALADCQSASARRD